jgi:hypothetical protein
MANAAKELTNFSPDSLDDSVLSSTEPVVLRGLVADWPIVAAGKQSPQAAADYLRQFYSGKPLTASYAPPAIKGRVGYNEDLSGFNFEAVTVVLDDFFDRQFSHVD